MLLGDNLQTTCLHCGSVFRITSEQLELAHGQARCNQCNQVFNALFSLENYVPPKENEDATVQNFIPEKPDYKETTDSELKTLIEQPVSLNQAMYGDEKHPKANLKPIVWAAGIILLIILTLVQIIYYQRYALISTAKYQQQILNLCEVLPCNESRFSNLAQIKLIERNVFSHPTQDNALMITGSFINSASFHQSLPDLLISLSDLNGNLIANRIFNPEEYLRNKKLSTIRPKQAVQFHLEISDPGTQALTYEFEFVS